jgi:uridine kinase
MPSPRTDTETPAASLRSTAEVCLRKVLSRPTTLGTGRLLCIDGPAGAGKSTLAGEMASVALLRECSIEVVVLHMDDLYGGWGGIGSVADRVASQILQPLAKGRPGWYHRWDWATGDWAERHAVEPTDVLILEGVGSAAAAYAQQIGTLVWIDAPAQLRLQRGIERDGEAVRDHWLRWMETEQAHLSANRTRQRADVVVNGVTGLVTPSRSA